MGTQPLLLVVEDDPDDQILIQNAIDGSCPPRPRPTLCGMGSN
jgi:hypothetical protein